MPAAVEIESVTKTFGPQTAVADLSLAVPEDSIYGFIGPNGSGKTTTLVLLDEPFSGLDPVNNEILREAILDLRKGGTTVIFSTHDMAVAEKMCDFIFMIDRGHKVLDGTLESIQDAYGSDTVRVRVEGDGVDLDGLPGVAKVTDFGRLQDVRLAAGADPQRVLAALMQRGRVR